MDGAADGSRHPYASQIGNVPESPRVSLLGDNPSGCGVRADCTERQPGCCRHQNPWPYRSLRFPVRIGCMADTIVFSVFAVIVSLIR